MKILKKTFSMFSRFRNRNLTSIIPSNYRMVIFDRSDSNISGNIMVTLLKA